MARDEIEADPFAGLPPPVAKVARDREMVALDARYPGYGLAQHKGYPTRRHLEALREYGVSEIHRRSFAPVRRLID